MTKALESLNKVSIPRLQSKELDNLLQTRNATLNAKIDLSDDSLITVPSLNLN